MLKTKKKRQTPGNKKTHKKKHNLICIYSLYVNRSILSLGLFSAFGVFWETGFYEYLYSMRHTASSRTVRLPKTDRLKY